MDDDDCIEAVHFYWFGPLAAGMPLPEHLKSRYRRWFGGDPADDRQIRRRFGDAVERALAGGFAQWSNSDRAAIALVLLLDQFPRNIYRGKRRAFAGDERARGLVHDLLDDGRDVGMAAIERCFLYLPLEHSEAVADHHRCVERFEALLRDYENDPLHTDAGLKQIRTSLDYARGHRRIVERFGRFPHRNAALGRNSSEAEQRWLDEGGARFGQ